jgi:hypothetical protein
VSARRLGFVRTIARGIWEAKQHDIVAIAKRPEDRHASTSSALLGSKYEGIVNDRRERPVGTIRAKTARDDIRTGGRVCPDYFHTRIGRVGNRSGEGGLRSYLIAQTGDEHQLAFGC